MMSHTRLRPLALAPALALALAAMVGVAAAYWTSSGQASNSASLATLPAPTITGAATGAETVELSWSAIVAPAEGTVEYYVTRDGGTPSAGCPSSSSRSTATSCTDTHVPVGAHKYKITAVWRSWTATGEEQAVTVAFGPATHLVLEAASATPLAGEADNLTVIAKDASNDTVGTYSGVHTLVFEGAGESSSGEEPVVSDRSGVERSFGESTEITFTEGKAIVSSSKNGVMKLYKAEAAHIKVKEGSLNNATGLAVTVKAATTKKLATSALAEQTAGTAFNVTLTATDTYGNTTTSYAGAKTLAWSEPSSSPSGKAPSYPATVTFTAGVGTASIKLYDAQSTTLKATEGTIEGTSGSFTVKAAAAKKFSVPTPSEQEAGVAFNVTLTALDEYSNVATSYTGSKTLTWSGPSSSPSGQAPEYPTSATTATFTAGVGTASLLKLYDAQSTTLKAKEGTIEGASGSFTIKAAAANSFSVPTPTEREAGVAFNVTVTAWDIWGNTTTSYAGSKTLTWSGPSSSPSGQAPEYPASATTVTFTAGVGTASALKLYDAQTTTLKAKEGTIEGITGSFTVKATTPEHFAWSHSEVTAGSIEASTCPFACKTTSIGASKKFKAHASVTDIYGNVVSNLGASNKAKVEKTSGEGTLTNATGLTIPSSGLAESSTIFEYTSPASGTSEAVLKLKAEEGTSYPEAEAHVKY